MVSHPLEWRSCGFHELHYPPNRKNKLQISSFLRLLEQPDTEALTITVNSWATEAINTGILQREGIWSESVMVGDEESIRLQQERNKGPYPGLNIIANGDTFALREQFAKNRPFLQLLSFRHLGCQCPNLT